MKKHFNPKIGKNVIETLTSGMYEDARFIYREYIQNAADQIDIAFEKNILSEKSEGEIKIKIDSKNKTISISDNATGIRADDVLTFLGDVANSQKDSSERKGFRGIGRLGGLGYCKKLIFETSFKGEKTQSKMTLDADQLKKIIADKNIELDAAAVISVITTIHQISDDINSHYFNVTLNGVENIELLNEESVREYLSMVAPIPFHLDFTFAKEIKAHYESKNIVLDEYNVKLNNKQLFKGYKNTFLEEGISSSILGVDYFEVRDEKKELIALAWYGFRDKSNNVLHTSVKERGIRIRKHNISIGNEDTLRKFFPVSRTNLRFIGEVHALSSSFIPNARRDYFNDNKTLQIFETQLRKSLQEENLENRIAQMASNIQNRLKEIEEYNKLVAETEKKEKFASKGEADHHNKKLKAARAKALKASKTLSKLDEKAKDDKNIGKLYKHIVGKKNVKIDPNKKIAQKGYNPPRFSKLTRDQAKIVREIFTILDKSLEFDDAEEVKLKIVKRYN